jgi:hypothetical protein
MKQKISTKSKKRVKFTTENERLAEIRYVGKFKTVVRYADTTVFDRFLFEEKITDQQFQIAEWMYTLALASGINISTSSFLNNDTGIRTNNKDNVSEKSVNARLVLNKCLDHVQERRGVVAKSLLTALVIYHKSIREWAKATASSRQGKLDLFKKTLDDLIYFRDHHI